MKTLKKRSMVAVLALVFTIGSMLTAAYAGGLYNAAPQETAAGYTCPVTGDSLPCSSCCPF